MRNNTTFFFILAGVIPFFLGVSPRPHTLKSFKMSIAGTSSLHKWESSVGAASVKSDILLNETGLEAINSLYFEVEAKSIKSTKGAVMDKKTWEALKTDQHPKISFQLTKIESISSVGGEYDIKALGNLSIAGVKQAIGMTVKAKVLSNGHLSIKGAKALKMTDYKIDPPTALMGTLKTGNDITINFEIVLGE
jgi:polyisoprenoid-binding protein YceI